MSFELRDDFGIINFLDDEGRGNDLLPEFLKSSENVNKLIRDVIMPEIQELHDSQADVYSTINIFEAVGSQLDDIFGEILNTERRPGQSDDDYRADLLIAYARFLQSGDIVTLKNMYRSIMLASFVRLYEYQPHEFRMHAQVESVSQNPPFTLSDGAAVPNSEFGLSGGTGTGGYLTDSLATVAAEIEARLAKAKEALTEAKQGGVTMGLTVSTDIAFTLSNTTPVSNSQFGMTDGVIDGGSLSTLF